MRKTQDQYLETAKSLNVPGLVDSFRRIMNASRSYKKYKSYLRELSELDWIVSSKNYEVTNEKYQMEIIYIVPDDSKMDGKKCITFKQIAEILQKNEDEVSKRFAQSLREWQKNLSF